MKSNRGFISIEVTMVLIILIAAMSIGLTWMGRSEDLKTNTSTANHGTTVKTSVEKFIKENRPAIIAAAQPLAVYSTGDIATYLPQNFVDKNPYGQSYSVRIFKNAAGELETLILTTGGEIISDANLRSIAQIMGGAGGYILSSNAALAVGSYGTWEMPLASFGASPGSGRLATALFFDESLVGNEYLHRNLVAGRPEYNQMKTNLSLGSNNITDVAKLNGASIELTGDLKAATVTTTGNIKTPAIADVGKLQVNDVVVENTPCPKNGLQAINNVGLPLSCQSGVFKSNSSSGTGMRALLAPLRGKQIACYAQGFLYQGQIDANGNPWVLGDYRGWIQGWTSGAASLSVDGLSVNYCDGNGNTGCWPCGAAWPMD